MFGEWFPTTLHNQSSLMRKRLQRHLSSGSQRLGIKPFQDFLQAMSPGSEAATMTNSPDSFVTKVVRVCFGFSQLRSD